MRGRAPVGDSGRHRWGAAALSLALVAAFGCAERLPGTAPPLDALLYPTGLAVSSDGASLFVVNGNLDQRYNASTVLMLSLDRLIEKYASEPAPAAGEVHVFDDLFDDQGSLIESAVRVDSLPGEAWARTGSDGTTEVFVASRLRDSVTRLSAEDGRLRCGADDEARLVGIDCGPSSVWATEFEDPLVGAFHPGPAGEDWLVVGHLRLASIEDGSPGCTEAPLTCRTGLSIVDLAGDGATGVATAEVPGLSGVAGLASMPGPVLGATQSRGLLALSAADGVWLEALSVDTASASPRLGLIEGGRMGLSAETGAVGARGMVDVSRAGSSTVSARILVTVRFDDDEDAVQSGMVTVRVTPGDWAVEALQALGGELDAPRKVPGVDDFVYVPDLRSDAIWVVDVRSARPRPVHVIEGWRTATDGRGRVKALDGIGSLVSFERDGRRYAVVSNTRSQTLSLLDLDGADPTAHRVVARFGAFQPWDDVVGGQ